ncbi:MAG: PKD domain-containing protein, partial [Candidatus Marinimicrobia bacterium]|nr:PKD domain-containing protein [Candidatus Neomarinimicrobiota bacterium]
FSATPRIGTRPVEITFSSMVENTIDSLRWTFGDGATSVLPSPVHTYSDTGQFEVTLMAYNTHGADTLTRNNYITVMPEYNVAADFSATPQLGVAPQSVTFQNNSIGTLDSVIWYFGDGDSSSLMHPIHTYDFPGNYSVSCIAFGPLNQDTLVQEAFINILDNRPMIQDIVDVPNDQGGRLLLNWERSGFDGGFNSTISQYSVWQQYQDTWISMGNYMANQSESYTTIINTFSDSTAENPNWSYFKVEAHTSAPGVFYSSLIDSGFSVDNVPPQIPGQLLAVIEPGNVNLEWNCYEEPQFMFYNVYRNGELIGESSSKSYVDVNYDEHTPNFYSVSSVDEAGNESQNSSRLFVDVDDLTWWLNLELTAQNGLEDLYNFIGVADSASDGFDPEYEYLEPPTPPGNYVSLYISHPEWDNTLGDDYSQDIRPEIDLSDTMQVWSLHVKSSIQDTLSLAINLIDTPNLPFIVEGPIGSDKEFMYDNMIITWLAQADSIYVLSISVGDTMPPNLALENNFEGPQVLVSDSSYSFQWLAQDGNQIDSSWVFSSYDGGNSFAQIFESAGGPDSFEWIIPDTSLLNQVLLGVRVSDYAGNTTWAQSNQPLIIAGHHQEFMIDTGWHLWSSPISAFNPSIFDELEPDIAGYWNFYGYDANGYSMDTLIHSGQSYWLANMEADTVMIDGNPIVNPSYEISLQSGWHLLATPYLVPSVVQDLLFRKDSVELFYSEAIDSAWITQLYGYDGLGYVGVSAIEPWQGYWLGVSDSLMMTIPLTNSQVAPARDLISPSWAIQLMASSINSVDNLNVIGIDSLAQMGFDANFDALEPPASPNPEYVSVYVDHPEWDHVLGTRFTSDIRTNLSEDQFHEWNIVVESDEDIVNITWELSGFPEYYELGIAQDSLSVFEDMRTLELVEVAVPATVIVRVGAHVLETENKSNLPSDYALFPNYPNPFNPSTTIRYNLPENDHVSLIVYDVKGRAVATIIDFQQTAGYYNVEWSGINDAGIPLSAGLYLCRLQAGSYSQTIKMLYLK